MTSEYWDQKVRDVEQKTLKGWLSWPIIEEEYIRPQVSGDSGVYYLSHFMTTHLKNIPVARALSLGCGGGNLERALIHMNAAQEIDAYDISTESVRLAQAMAQDEGIGHRIHYGARDLNTIELPPNTYDFVIIKMALHHFEGLEHIYRQIAASLKPGGVFVFNEFIGPTRYQWTDFQLHTMNKVLNSLPKKNTWSVWTQDYLKEIVRPTVDEMIALDPSEAVRSAEIMPVLAHYFDVIEYKPYGGTILHILLNHIMESFDLDDPEDVERLRGLFALEKALIQNGVLESDFAYVVAKPKPNTTSAIGATNKDFERIQAKVNQYPRWQHRIEICPGLITPGQDDTRQRQKRLDRIGLPENLSGKRVLDLGTGDGYFAFLMEQRGAAEIVAIEHRLQAESGFGIASDLLNSSVQHRVEDLQQLTPYLYGTFDVILVLNGLDHFRNPLYVLDTLRRMCKDDGLLFIETPVIDNAFITPDGTLTSLNRLVPQLSTLSLWQFHSRTASSPPRWIPSMAALQAMLEEAQFKIHDCFIYGESGGIKAGAVVNDNPDYLLQ